MLGNNGEDATEQPYWQVATLVQFVQWLAVSFLQKALEVTLQ